MLTRFAYSGKPARTHGTVTRVVHLLAGALLIYGLIFSADIETLSDPAAVRSEVRFAVFLGGVFLLRLGWIVLAGGGSRLPSEASRWEHILSRFVHYGIYALVLAVIATGLAIAANASAGSLPLGISPSLLRNAVSQDVLLEAHEAFASALIGLILIHLCGALWHWIVRKDGVWEAMLGHAPWLKSFSAKSRQHRLEPPG